MVYITDDLRLSKLDDMNFMLEEKRMVHSNKNKSDTERWVFSGYYGKLEHVLSAILNKKMLDSVQEASSVKELYDALISAKNELVEIVEQKKIQC